MMDINCCLKASASVLDFLHWKNAVIKPTIANTSVMLKKKVDCNQPQKAFIMGQQHYLIKFLSNIQAVKFSQFGILFNYTNAFVLDTQMSWHHHFGANN